MTMNFKLEGTVLTITGSGTLSKFAGYEDVTKIIVEGDFTKVDHEVFYGKTSMEELILPDSIEEVGNFLLGTTKIKSFHIPLNLNKIDTSQPFDQALYLEKFTIDPKHKYLSVVDGILYSKDLKTLVSYPGGKKGNVFTIPDGVDTIFAAGIGKNTYLKHIIVPPSVIKRAGFGYLSTAELLTVFRCEQENEKDTFLQGMDKNFKPNIVIKKTKYQYSLNGDGSVLTVYPMKGCHYQRNNFISFDEEQSFKNNLELTEVIFKGGFNSSLLGNFEGCSNLKRISFPNNRIHKICTMKHKMYQRNNSFITSLIICIYLS